MARLCAVANGNNTAAATWAVIDSASYTESETGTLTVPTTYATTYTAFTPGAITVDGLAIKLANRTGTTGTFSAELYSTTGSVSVAGTEVTVNCSDFVDALSASIDGGWYFFKFAAPVLLVAATNYIVRFKTSSATQIVVFTTGSVSVPAKFVRTTTTQAPVAGDDRFVMGEWTAAGTTTTRTVTLDDTSTVDYGSASTSTVTPALSISAGGIVLAGTTASTTYIQKISGNVVVYNGGILRIATSGSRMPTTSSFTWTFDCAANVDFGIDIRRKGEFTAYGEDKTRWTLLTGDEAASQTVIGLTSTTGWKVGDTLMFPTTGTSSAQSETKAIQTVDSSTQVTLTAGLTNAHTGSGDVVGEVANLTCNISILGISTSIGTYICYFQSSLGVLDNINVRYFGSSSSNKQGVESQHINTSTNSCTINKCSFMDLETAGKVGNTQGAGAFYYITNCVVYLGNNSTSTIGIHAAGGFTGTPDYDVTDNLIVFNNTNCVGLRVGGHTGTTASLDRNRLIGGGTGISFSETYGVGKIVNISDCIMRANSNGAANVSSTITKVMTNCNFTCNTNGLSSTGPNITLTTCNFIGNSSTGANIVTSSNSHLTTTLLTFNSCIFRGRSGFAQPIGFNISSDFMSPAKVVFNLCDFGTTTAHTTADVNVSAYYTGILQLNSCTLASSTEFNSTATSFLIDTGLIAAQRIDNTDGNHRAIIQQGIVTPDTTIFRTASPSVRITPKSASVETITKLFPFQIKVPNGQTATPSVYVRESVVGDGTDYNGNRIKLYVATNYNAGITSDTLLDTATASSVGTFEQLTGTTAAVGDDCVLDFYITCDGTTGWINYDDFTGTT